MREVLDLLSDTTPPSGYREVYLVRFDIKTPCPTCPFRNDRRFYLRPERAEQIARDMLKGATFQCHYTLKYSDDEDDEGEAIVMHTPTDQHCAGAAIMLTHMNRPNTWMQISGRMGFHDPDAFDLAAPVFRHADEFIKANYEQDRE